MKKQIYTLICLFFIVAAMILIYYANLSTAGDAEDEPYDPLADEDIVVLINRSKSDIESITYHNPDASYTLVRANEGDNDVWVMEEYPGIKLSDYFTNAMITPMFYLSPYEKLLDETDDYAEFGLTQELGAYAVARYADGTTETVISGSKTPAGDFYYLRYEGDPGVYLVFPSTGQRFYSGYNEIVDKSLLQLDINSLYRCRIEERGTVTFDIQFADLEGNTDHTSFRTHMETLGETFVTMLSPLPGRQVYMSAFSKHLEGFFEGYRLGELAELDCADFSEYGLDEPALSVYFEDYNGSLLIEAGGYADEAHENVYVRINGGQSVFLMEARFLDGFYDIRPFLYIERYVVMPLPNIGTVDNIQIDAEHERGVYYDCVINHADDPPNPTGGGDIAPTINNVPVNDDDFREFYKAVIMLQIEGFDYDYDITGEPAVTVTYNFNENTDAQAAVTEYYDYSAVFYAVSIPDSDSVCLVSKQLMRVMFEFLEKML